MNEVNEASPASVTSDVERVVIRRFCLGDAILAMMIVIPITLIFTGFTVFHAAFFFTSFIGYAGYVYGAITWRDFRWYADV